MSDSAALPSSFRDPSGFMYTSEGVLYRSVAPAYQAHYEALMKSGLYDELVKKGLLVAHQEVSGKDKNVYKTLKPEKIPFISYPYEWSFSQLKAAALATLEIQFLALEKGLMLKDASAYNIQFHQGKPILIDTLSFEVYKESEPWIAYKQFCQHFLAPLALTSYLDLRLGTLSQTHLDGVPLDLTSRLLPPKTRFSLGLSAHIHLHARSQTAHANDAASKTTVAKPTISKNNLTALLKNLEGTVQGLKAPHHKTEWGNYYEDTNYTEAGRAHKEKVISEWITELKPKNAWDAGANDGTFSRLAASQGIFTVASDIDPIAVDKSYLQVMQDGETQILPLVLDLTNPSPAIGWNNTERSSFNERAHFDLSMALAFIHHLCLSNNLPFDFLASFFAAHTKYLIIEFVPKEDSNSQRLLVTREDIFPDYHEEGFEKAFGKYFKLEKKVKVKESKRTLYLFKTK